MLLGYELLQGQTGHEAGRALLSRLYRQYTGQAIPAIKISERGKPYFPDGKVFFSISHTPKHVFCAISDRPIGIDAEEADRNIRPALAEKILSDAELSQYRTAADPRLALLAFWVLKEAAAKCSGLGLQGYPCHTAFSLDDPRLQQIDGCLVAVIEEENYAV